MDAAAVSDKPPVRAFRTVSVLESGWGGWCIVILDSVVVFIVERQQHVTYRVTTLAAMALALRPAGAVHWK
jgi:hypothetical protein